MKIDRLLELAGVQQLDEQERLHGKQYLLVLTVPEGLYGIINFDSKPAAEKYFKELFKHQEFKDVKSRLKHQIIPIGAVQTPDEFLENNV